MTKHKPQIDIQNDVQKPRTKISTRGRGQWSDPDAAAVPAEILPWIRFEEIFDLLFAGAPVGVALVSLDFHFFRVNQRLTKILGYSAREFSRITFPDITHPDDLDQDMAQALNMADGKVHEYNTEKRYIHKDGYSVHAGLSVRLIRDFSAKPLFFLSYIREISSETHVGIQAGIEKETRKQREFLNTVLRSLTMPVYVIDAEDYRILLVNPAAEGRRKEKDHPCFRFAHQRDEPCDGKQYTCPIREVKATGKPCTVEHTHHDAGGRLISEEIHGFPVTDEAGTVRQVIITTQDITERKKAEQELKKSEGLYRTLVETAPFGVTMTDLNGLITFVSPQTVKIHGYDEPEELLGRNAFILIDPIDQNRAQENLRKALSGIILKDVEYNLLKRDGGTFVGELNVAMIRDEEGRPAAFIATTQDISQRKLAEQKITDYGESQSILLQEVNHRVKNNLSALIGMIHKEEEYASNRGITEHIPVFRDLEGRIQGLLTVHTLLTDRGWRPVLLHELCERVINNDVHAIAHSRKAKIKITPSGIKVNSNQAHHLTVILNELTMNTFKHAAPSRRQIKISVEIEEMGDQIHLIYRDNGIGYPEELLKNDFSNASIGFDLIRGTVRKNLAGYLELSNHKGAVARIIFEPHYSSDGREIYP